MKNPGDFFGWLANAVRQSRALTHMRQGRSIKLEQITADVPCGECKKCCKNGMQLPVFPDEPKWYKTEKHDGIRFLKHDPDGSCAHYHRTKGHCMIYDRRPILCRSYDCRMHLASRMVEVEIEDIAAQWDQEWYRDSYRGLVLLAIHLAARDADKEVPGANSIIASDRGIARFPEYLGAAMTQFEETRAKFEQEKEPDTPKLILPPGVH